MRFLVEVGVSSGNKIRFTCTKYEVSLNTGNRKYSFVGLRGGRTMLFDLDRIEYVRVVRRCL
jgi:hypothetical protein